ncbi:MAG: ABC transporter permease [Pyrinomonadaceae bacterium]
MLVITEIAVALVLLIGAGLLINSFVRLQRVDPGFNAQRVLTFNLDLPVVRYPMSSPQVSGFYTNLRERLQALPGVTSVSTAQAVPLSGYNNSTSVEIEGSSLGRQSANLRFINLDYFRTMSIPLLQGRDFTARDDVNAPSYVVVNETFARRLPPNESPLGKRLSLSWGGGKPKEIIGVVKDVKHESLSAERQPEMYRSANSVSG